MPAISMRKIYYILPAMLLGLALLPTPISVSAQRGKALKKITTPAAKIYTMYAAQSQLTVLLTQEGMLRKVHPTHLLGVKISADAFNCLTMKAKP